MIIDIIVISNQAIIVKCEITILPDVFEKSKKVVDSLYIPTLVHKIAHYIN